MTSSALILALWGLISGVMAAADPVDAQERVSSRAFQEFLRHPDSHQHIPNNSFAGFRYGIYNRWTGADLVQEAFPGYRQVDMKRNGATGDGSTDDTKAILAALAQAGPGTVLYFPAGTYVISDILRITRGDIVLKGDGPGRTVFLFQKSLNDVLGPFLKEQGPYYNRWSNHGGLIWVAPANIWKDNQEYRYKKPGPEGLDLGWMNAVTIGRVVRPAKRGDDAITVACRPGTTAAQLTDGLLIMNWKNDPQNELLAHFSGHDAYKRYPWDRTPKLKRDWEWACEVKRLAPLGGDTWTLTLKQPLRIDIRDMWAVDLRRPEPLGGSARYIENVAFQGLTLKMKGHEAWRHFHEPGFNALFFQRSFNCLVHDVDTFDSDNAFVLESSKCITIRKTRLLGDEKRHHGYYFRYNVHDCIVTDFLVGACGNEALSISYRSSGNVFHSGILQRGSFDSHRGLPFDLIRSDITLERNDGHQGGSAESGPRNGARVVHWNITDRSRTGYAVSEVGSHPSGLLAGIRCDRFLPGREPGMPDGPLDTLMAPLDEEALPTDVYGAMTDALADRRP